MGTTICQYFLRTCINRKGATALMIYKRHRTEQLTWSEYQSKVAGLAASLKQLGVARGDRIGIMSKTRAEWALADLAIMSIGAVTVPFFHNALPEDISYIVENAAIKTVFIERLGLLKSVAVNLAIENIPNKIFFEGITEGPNLLSTFIQNGQRLCAHDHFNLNTEILKGTAEDLATIIYTSGTTGRPKGVALTHRQLVSEVQTFKLVGMTEQDRSMPFLPFAHVLGRIEVWGHAFLGHTLAFGTDPDRIKDNLELTRPTILLAVPRLFEKIHSGLLHQIENHPVKKALFNWAVNIGMQYVDFRHRNKRPPPAILAQYLIAKKLVFSKILKKLGGRLTRAVCGGAALDPKLSKFFEAVGIRIFEGYGLTETTAAVTVNTPAYYRPGSVGRPIGQTKIKIAEDGEVLIHSPMVMAGYYNDPHSTKQSVKNGWLHTGDIGTFCEDGFLRITDRKKDLIKTTSGKYVAPQKLESMLKTYNLISQVHIIGQSRKHIAALITLNADHMPKIKKNVKKQVDQIINDVNARLGEHEYIKTYKILKDDFTVESGEITPSMKIRKQVVEENYKKDIDSLYASV